MSSPELDKWLKELDSSIYRSEEQSRVTLQQIKNKKDKRPKKKLYPLIASILAIPIGAILLFSFIFSDSDIGKETTASTNPYMEVLKEEKISRSLVSKSKSIEIFTPNVNQPFLLGVAVIDDDKRWNNSLKKGLLKMEATNEVPSADPQYDLLISFDKGTVLKFKLWTKEKNLILKDTVKGQHYIIEDMAGIQYVLKQMTTIPLK